MSSLRKELFCPLQGSGMGLNTWETPDNSISWIWEHLGGLQMHQTLGMLWYQNHRGKRGAWDCFPKGGGLCGHSSFPCPSVEGQAGLSASAPSASDPICTSPSASPNLHSPICSIPNPTICKPGRADGKDTLPSGAPHSWLGSGELSAVRSAESSCPHATLPPMPWQSTSSPAPCNCCSKTLPLVLLRNKEKEAEGNFLLYERCEGTKRVINYFCVSMLWAGCATYSKGVSSSSPKSISDFSHSSLVVLEPFWNVFLTGFQ